MNHIATILCAALGAALLASAGAAGPGPPLPVAPLSPLPLSPRSMTCKPYSYENATDPATGGPACAVTQGVQCEYSFACAIDTWFCPFEGCGDPVNRQPHTCGDFPRNRTTCRFDSNGVVGSSWAANATVAEENGRCFYAGGKGLYVGPPFSRSISFAIWYGACKSTAPCRWDLLSQTVNQLRKTGPSAGTFEASRILHPGDHGRGSFSPSEVCLTAMQCPPMLGLLSSGPEIDYGGTQFACIPTDAAFREGIVVKRDGLGRAVCLTDGSGACLVLPGSCCGAMDSNSSSSNVAAISPIRWPTRPCTAGEDWCGRALAAVEGRSSSFLLLGYNCTLTTSAPAPYNVTANVPDPNAGPWVVQRYDNYYSGPTSNYSFLYRAVRRMGNGSIAAMGYRSVGSDYVTTFALGDAGCAANLVRTAPAGVAYAMLPSYDKANNDSELLWILGLDPNRAAPQPPPDPPTPPGRGSWTCVQLCSEGGNWAVVRYYGVGGGVQCRGNNAGGCSLYRDSGCTDLADGEYAPHPSGEVGYVCSPQDQASGWCAHAAAAVLPWNSGTAACAPTEIRQACNGTCSPSATCVRSGRETFCSCNEGFFGDGKACSPDPCRTGNGGCSPQATCIPSVGGSVACTCWPGYFGSGRSCLPDPCATNNGGCSRYARCSPVWPSGNTCACGKGYVGDGRRCMWDYCAQDGICPPNAVCSLDSQGAPRCYCTGAYTSNGTHCVSKCLYNNGGCSRYAACSIRNGAIACACKAAYYGNGRTCTAKAAVRLALTAPATVRRGRRATFVAKATNSKGKALARLQVTFQVGSGAKVKRTTGTAGTCSYVYAVPARAVLGKIAVSASFPGTSTLLPASARKTAESVLSMGFLESQSASVRNMNAADEAHADRILAASAQSLERLEQELKTSEMPDRGAIFRADGGGTIFSDVWKKPYRK
ncbi:hypothetical protein DFJ74DRAFT_714067 [Hyaloraphidium curvatum]|nr:hypothetical protein DFJ74DRAFT_714067 [Hyaloraphidium curvatum]